MQNTLQNARLSNLADPYLYPGTSILKNSADLLDQAKLDRFERVKTTMALNDLHKNPIKGPFHAARFLETHRRIFQEVYPFAGQFRTVDLVKAEPKLSGASVGYSNFVEARRDLVHHLDKMSGRDWSPLQNSADPKSMEQFAKDTIELLRVHPFREGNTRTTMTYVMDFARDRNFAMDRDLFAQNPQFVRDALVVGTLGVSDHLTRIMTDARNRELEKERSLTGSDLDRYTQTKDLVKDSVARAETLLAGKDAAARASIERALNDVMRVYTDLEPDAPFASKQWFKRGCKRSSATMGSRAMS